MKNRRFKFKYRKSASKLHRTVGDFLRTFDLFKNYNIWQEYPVVKVNPTYSHSSHHFDWVIQELKIVIECHGKQHFEPVAFDGDMERAVAEFPALQARDEAKAQAAIDAGWTYIIIPYTMKNRVNSVDFMNLLENARKRVHGPAPYDGNMAVVETPRQKYLKSDRHKEELKRAREYRREQYQRQKEWKKAHDRNK